MTSIEQLQVCGIRSFDPKPSNKQTVQFQKPLTVILGKNGAGKTTIIEALLNACTGSMPPGSGTEKSSFVYDPKVIGESEVKAQIRLIFTGKGGKVMQVIRSFQVSRQRNKTVFNTLDNTVAFQHPGTGKVISNTYRASDVDRIVPELLGVSSAVLEHVIFCHQEHCNWPLLPPKDVKQIFDDIFAATRYVTALERLRDNSKEYRRQQKEHESSLFALREYREQAAQLQHDIDRKEEAVRSIQSRNHSIEPDLKRLREASAALQSIRQNIESLEREAILISSRIEERRERISRFRLPPCKQSLEEMLEIRRNFSTTISEAEETLTKKTAQLNGAQDTILQKKGEAMRTQSDIHALEREVAQHKTNCAALKEIVSKVGDEFVVGEGGVDEASLTRVMRSLKENLDKLVIESKQSAQKFEQAMMELEELKRTHQRQVDAEEKEKELIQKQLGALRGRVSEAQTQLSQLGSSDAERELTEVQRQIAQLEDKVKAAEELRKKGEHFQRREKIGNEISVVNQNLTALRQVLHKKKISSDGASRVAAERQAITDREIQMEVTVKEELMPLLHSIQISSPSPFSVSTVSLSVESLLEKKQAQLRQVEETLSQTGRHLAVDEGQYAVLVEEITSGDFEAGKKMKVVQAVIPGKWKDSDERYRQELEAAKASYHQSREKVFARKAMSSVYGEYIEAAQKDNVCSVCDRPFSNHEELSTFQKKNQNLLDTTPQITKELEEASREALTRLNILEEIESSVASLLEWGKKKPQLERKAKELLGRIESLKQRREDAEVQKETIEHMLETVKQVSCVIFGLNMQLKDIQKQKAELGRAEKQLESVLSTDDDFPNKTYEDVLLEYEDESKKLLELNNQLNEARRQDEGGVSHDWDEELRKKRDQRHSLELKVVKQRDLQTTIASTEGEIEAHKKRLTEIGAHYTEIQEKLDQVNRELSTKREAQQKVESTLQGRIKEEGNVYQRAEEMGKKVLDYIRSDKPKRLSHLRQELTAVEKSIQEIESEIPVLSKEIAQSRTTIGAQHKRSVEIEEQVSLLELQRACQTDEARLKETNKALSDLKASKIKGVGELLGSDTETLTLNNLQDLITAELSKLEKTRAQQEGNVEAMVQDLSALKAQLMREKYQDVEKRYRSTYLKVQTAEMAVKDVERYYTALEKAVQSYHQEKITQINRIIAELWGVTYRGSDIDTVEIHSETENTTTTSARRSYSYRVVMKRENKEIDMRGRCSAGQKVLASIIIRLALSEAFCTECGILALDEPTTNLDEDNARSLAEALRTLIESRRSVVKHFQLIVITHDEQFVRALGGHTLDKFFYVHKDREGAFSVIEERTFEQLFA